MSVSPLAPHRGYETTPPLNLRNKFTSSGISHATIMKRQHYGTVLGHRSACSVHLSHGQLLPYIDLWTRGTKPAVIFARITAISITWISYAIHFVTFSGFIVSFAMFRSHRTISPILSIGDNGGRQWATRNQDQSRSIHR